MGNVQLWLRCSALALFFLLVLGTPVPLLANAPKMPAESPAKATAGLTLATEFHGQNVIGWAMSEKLDGVRGYWDGKQLFSRSGRVFMPPKDFTENFPPFALDGELFLGRGRFAELSGMVRSTDSDWEGVHLHVFDVPKADGGLYERLQRARDWLAMLGEKGKKCRFTVIEQRPVRNMEEARHFLQEVERKGGEGVIFRDPALPYQTGRSAAFLKWKSQFDAECTIKAHHPGKGKYAGLLGAVTCENEHGRFRIGSGWSEAERRNPPPVGTVITYRYRGFTAKGLPRFATYLRRTPEP